MVISVSMEGPAGRSAMVCIIALVSGSIFSNMFWGGMMPRSRSDDPAFSAFRPK